MMNIVTKTSLVAFVLSFGYCAWAGETVTLQNMKSVMENQGSIDSVDLDTRTITIDGKRYLFHPNLEVIWHTSEGVERMDARQLSPDMPVGIDEEDGAIRRLHVLDAPAI